MFARLKRLLTESSHEKSGGHEHSFEEKQLAAARETAKQHAQIEYQTALQSERLLRSAVEAQKLLGVSLEGAVG